MFNNKKVYVITIFFLQPTTITFKVGEKEPDPFTTWFEAFEKAIQDYQKNNLIYHSNYDHDHTMTITIPEEDLSLSGILSLLSNPVIQFPQGKGGIEKRTEVIDMLTNVSLPLDNRLKESKLNQYMTGEQIDELIKKVLPEPVYQKKESTFEWRDGKDLTFNDNKKQLKGKSRRNEKEGRPPVLPLFNISEHENILKRVRRQAVLDVPIPILQSFYPGKQTFH